jgi:E3 ubiquitin-protein ligase SIAH1
MSEKQERKRGSAPGDGEPGRKKPRAQPQAVAPGGVVKQEPEEEGDATQGSNEGEASQGSSEGGGSVMAVQAMDEPRVKLTIGVSLLHCQACVLPLKPPTFKVRFFFIPIANFLWKCGSKSSIFWERLVSVGYG